jgi:hypothetical protein
MSPTLLTDSSGSSTPGCAQPKPVGTRFTALVHTIHTPDDPELDYSLIIGERNVRQAA